MKRLLFLVLASFLLVAACGQKEKEETKTEEKKKDTTKDKKETKKENKSVEKKKDENTNKSEIQSETSPPNITNDVETSTPNITNNVETVPENEHQVGNNPINDRWKEGDDPIYKYEYKHIYTPEEARRAQENSDRINRELGLEEYMNNNQ